MSDFACEVFNHHPDGFFIGPSKDGLAVLLTTDETGMAEFLDMMGNGGERHIKIIGHGTNRRPFFRIEVCLAVAGTDTLEDTKAGFIRQRFEGGGNIRQMFLIFAGLLFFCFSFQSISSFF
jgi:hypothetical protein